jgi:hypothetical protein
MSKLNPNETVIRLPDDIPWNAPEVLRSGPSQKQRWQAARTRLVSIWC